MRIKPVEELCGHPRLPISDRVKGAGGADEFQDLLADAVHIDGERNPAEAHQRNTQFLLPHKPGPRDRWGGAADLRCSARAAPSPSL
jgi:hypothetical protein